jgi:multiple sugar transport system permease protein
MTDLPTSRIDLKAVLSGSSATVAMADHSEGMSYLQSVPRRIVTLYLPLAIIVFILLFPFYWMGLTAIKPDDQLLDLDKFNPFWTWNPTFKHIHKLLFESYYPHWLWNTMYVAICATILSIVASVLAAYAIVRLRYRGAQWVASFSCPIWCRPRSFSFRSQRSCSSMAFSTRRWR